MISNLKKLLFLGALFSVSSLCLAKIVPYTDCGSTATINKIDISPCEFAFNDDGCALPKGKNVSFDITYTPSKNHAFITQKVFGYLTHFARGIPFNAIRGNAQNNHNATFPLVQGIKVLYRAVVPILASYPTFTVNVEYSLLCGTEKVVCVNIPTRIVRSDGTVPTPRPRRIQG